MAVMGNGDIVVGKNPPARTLKTVISDNLAKRGGAPAPAATVPSDTECHSGAMSQQRCNGGTVSTPQQFLHLVGCHETKARTQGRR
jgi:hypothetical protein